MGLTFMVILLMSGITRKFIHFSKNIEKANKQIKLSEKKYRLLTEGTEDCIFTLNKHFYFINANKQTFKKLNLKEENLGKTHFLDMLYLEKEHKDFFRDFVRDKLETLINTRERVNLRVRLKSFFSTEPKSYNISFEYLETKNDAEIICKASQLQEDIILKHIQAESGKYVIDNYMLTIEEICTRLVNYLPKFLDNESIGQVRIGLRELLINAVEHGNLNISFDEKSEAMANNNYFIFIRNRQEAPEYKDKKITVEYSLSPSKVVYRITDSGDGFDVASTFKSVKTNTEDLKLHGRGILMATGIFDKVSYNTKGNMVTLTKEFNK
jgi:anti-sigma regulatory factor (Ser/Thr protein kinase)